MARGEMKRKGPALLWIGGMAVCLVWGSRVVFNGDLRAVQWVPEELQRIEADFKKTWGDFRDKAMVWVEGPTLESALQENEGLFRFLQGRLPASQWISLAPLLPSPATQRENIARWQAFWSPENRERFQRRFLMEGDKIGFTDQAFAPFFARLKQEPRPVSLEGWKKAGLGGLLESLIITEGKKIRVLTLVPDDSRAAALLGEGRHFPPSARWLSPSTFSQEMGQALVRNFFRYLALSSVLILLLVSLLFRKPTRILACMVPVVSGVLFMFGGMGCFGLEFNLFNIMASILVIGLCVDLGIFTVSRRLEGYNPSTAAAVLLSGLTSLVGMGALILARHPALFSIGATVLLGMCGAIPAALWVTPVFLGSDPEPGRKNG